MATEDRMDTGGMVEGRPSSPRAFDDGESGVDINLTIYAPPDTTYGLNVALEDLAHPRYSSLIPALRLHRASADCGIFVGTTIVDKSGTKGEPFGSIEELCAIVHVDPAKGLQGWTFRHHRDDEKARFPLLDPQTGLINALAFDTRRPSGTSPNRSPSAPPPLDTRAATPSDHALFGGQHAPGVPPVPLEGSTQPGLPWLVNRKQMDRSKVPVSVPGATRNRPLEVRRGGKTSVRAKKQPASEARRNAAKVKMEPIKTEPIPDACDSVSIDLAHTTPNAAQSGDNPLARRSRSRKVTATSGGALAESQGAHGRRRPSAVKKNEPDVGGGGDDVKVDAHGMIRSRRQYDFRDAFDMFARWFADKHDMYGYTEATNARHVWDNNVPDSQANTRDEWCKQYWERKYEAHVQDIYLNHTERIMGPNGTWIQVDMPAPDVVNTPSLDDLARAFYSDASGRRFAAPSTVPYDEWDQPLLRQWFLRADRAETLAADPVLINIMQRRTKGLQAHYLCRWKRPLNDAPPRKVLKGRRTKAAPVAQGKPSRQAQRKGARKSKQPDATAAVTASSAGDDEAKEKSAWCETWHPGTLLIQNPHYREAIVAFDRAAFGRAREAINRFIRRMRGAGYDADMIRALKVEVTLSLYDLGVLNEGEHGRRPTSHCKLDLRVPITLDDLRSCTRAPSVPQMPPLPSVFADPDRVFAFLRSGVDIDLDRAGGAIVPQASVVRHASIDSIEEAERALEERRDARRKDVERALMVRHIVRREWLLGECHHMLGDLRSDVCDLTAASDDRSAPRTADTGDGDAQVGGIEESLDPSDAEDEGEDGATADGVVRKRPSRAPRRMMVVQLSDDIGEDEFDENGGTEMIRGLIGRLALNKPESIIPSMPDRVRSHPFELPRPHKADRSSVPSPSAGALEGTAATSASSLPLDS